MAQAPVDRSVSAVDRTLAILDAFAEGDSVLTLTELEERTGLFKSVICRYMLSFERLGYVVKRIDGKYQLGSQVLRLGRAFERTFDMADIVMPLLRTLTDKTRESASFYVREGDMRLCLYRIESSSLLRVAMHPGSKRPIDETATGQVFSRFGNGVRLGLQADPSSYLRSSANITSDGDPDYVASLSMPVFGFDHELLGALTVSGPMQRLNPELNIDARRALVESARALSAQFGGKDPYPEGDQWYLPSDYVPEKKTSPARKSTARKATVK